jgi:DNA-binding response OmpR family regulator
MKIMIIEDDKNIRQELRVLLESAGYEVAAIDGFDGAASQILRENPALVLLDVYLPGQGGREICAEVRRTADVPIIFVTSDSDVMGEISGMLAGGDDYITKPYHPSLLLARIAAVLKRAQKKTEESSTITHKGVTLDTRAYKLSANGKQAEISKNECKLMHYMFLHPGEVIPRLELIEYLWDNEAFIDDNALSVTVARLRGRLEELGVAGFIETKRGAGYRI